jgi:pSer/pThr/pTyr-binding forkhead associated (FHA) protein
MERDVIDTRIPMRRYALKTGKQAFSLAPGVYRIGRGPTSDIRLDDASVSRAHACLRVEPDRVVIEELSSRNGLRVNGAARRGATPLTPGDTIRVGNVELTLFTPDPTPDDAAAAATRPLPKLAEHAEPALSAREREVLEKIARGVTQREIAESLGLSVKTVETYRARIADKLGLESRAALVDYAIRVGFLRPRAGSSPPRSG